MHPPSLMGGGILLETKSNIVHPVFNKYDYTMLCHSASVRQRIAMRNEYVFTLLPTLEDLNCNTVQPGARSIIVCSLLEKICFNRIHDVNTMHNKVLSSFPFSRCYTFRLRIVEQLSLYIRCYVFCL
jgi:hypothetical protein